MNRKQIEANREQMGMADPLWELYPTTGLTYKDIIESKPQTKPGQTILWTVEKGWEVIDEIQGHTQPNGRDNRKVPKSRGKSAN